jgi:hypothetical protein
MIAVKGYFTATNPNLVANSDLQSAPEDGVLAVQIVCTQVNWTWSLSAGNDTPLRNQVVDYKATALINQNDDPVVIMPVLAGQQIVLQCTVGTAGAGAYLVRFISEAEL